MDLEIPGRLMVIFIRWMGGFSAARDAMKSMAWLARDDFTTGKMEARSARNGRIINCQLKHERLSISGPAAWQISRISTRCGLVRCLFDCHDCINGYQLPDRSGEN
jgi:hypothetical protein